MFGLPKPPHYQETYEYGFPEYKRKAPVVIKVTDTSLDFYFNKMFKYVKIEIPFDDIIEIGLDSETYRSGGKAATGAIIGGVLTGGIGLLAGAAIGGKRRKQNTLQLSLIYNNENCVIALKPSKRLPKLYADLKRKLPVNKDDANEKPADITSELEKYHSLMEKGIITKDEFEQKKKELL